MAKKEAKKALSYEEAVREISKLEGENAVDLPQTQIKKVLRGLEEVVTSALAENRKVQLTGFFSCAPVYRSARKANNVMTGEIMEVPESVGVTIKAGKKLKDATNDLKPKTVKKSK